MARILITPRSLTKHGHAALDVLTQAGHELVMSTPGAQPGEDELCALLPGCVGYLAGVEKITARVLSAADQLRVISRNGTGVDNIDLATAEARKITIRRAEGANARGVAELAFAHLLGLMRSISRGDQTLKQGGWDRWLGSECAGRTLGLIGCGRIGRLLAAFALGFGFRVLAYDPYPDPTFAPADQFSYASFADVIAGSDALSLHCPPGKHGPLINAETLARMRHGAFIINTARWELLDPDAALEALESGRLAGLALDVFDAEPPNDRRLLVHPRVVATAHVGGFTSASVARAVSIAARNILESLD
jgi:phosphoglycerate dehydrogenase-like enzyme